MNNKTRSTLKEKGYERKAGLDLYELFDSVAAEIQERETFLTEMRQLGQADQYEDKLRREMKERFQELERINRLIREEEEKET